MVPVCGEILTFAPITTVIVIIASKMENVIAVGIVFFVIMITITYASWSWLGIARQNGNSLSYLGKKLERIKKRGSRLVPANRRSTVIGRNF
jgi:hypothetical protein